MTEVIDLRGRLLIPGFIDAHTHFGNAAAWLFRISLYEVHGEREALEAVASAARRIPEGLWISGGDLGAASAWAADAEGRPRPDPMRLDIRALDAATPAHPVLLRRVDGAYIANSLALARARTTPGEPDPRGGRIERDPATGEPTWSSRSRARGSHSKTCGARASPPSMTSRALRRRRAGDSSTPMSSAARLTSSCSGSCSGAVS